MDMQGVVCLVTGATSGIGEATAIRLAELGATVVVAGRDPRRCARVLRRMEVRTGRTPVPPLVADLSSQAGVRHAAAEFRARHEVLHVLVNNAGGYFRERLTTVDDLEMTFALNHLASFLLTNLLLEPLRAGRGGRVVTVASEDHRTAGIDFEDLQGERAYDRRKAYAQSKLANLLFTFELGRRHPELAVNALCPGSVRTNLGANNGWLRKRLLNLLDRHRVSPEVGAELPVRLASDPALAGVSGRYFVRGEACLPSEAAQDPETARRLWDLSLALTGLDRG
jgi:NAD(P)-dependent dehydrogenase (short-subunit alcohol dehydrogenase family)